MSAIANQKFNQLHLQGTNLSITVQRTAMRAPTRTPQESEDLAPYSTPCQQETAKRPMFRPNSQSSGPTLIIIKEKNGEMIE
jgi:hypothetical protein